MRRREFITLVGGAAAWPLSSGAAPALPVIGWVNAGSEAEWASLTAAFRRGLTEAGFVAGKNLIIEYRWADGDLDRMLAMVADLVAREVSVLIVGGNIVGLRAALAATRRIPIVFTTAADPVAAGIVSSLNRPGGNATGFALLVNEVLPKRLELLHELIPGATRIALLVSPHNPAISRDDIESASNAARSRGLEVIVENAGTETEIEHVFADAVGRGAGAVLAGSDTFFLVQRERLAALGLRYAIPVIGNGREDVISGGLMSYGFDGTEMFRAVGTYAARILKGENPSDLPVVQASKFDFVINLKTAKSLGLVVPPALLAIANEVLE